MFKILTIKMKSGVEHKIEIDNANATMSEEEGEEI